LPDQRAEERLTLKGNHNALIGCQPGLEVARYLEANATVANESLIDPIGSVNDS
jgi:hypothetical protein